MAKNGSWHRPTTSTGAGNSNHSREDWPHTRLGVPLGVLASAGVGQGLRSALVGVTPLDPVVLGGVCLIVFVVSAGALFLPSRNAASTDPAVDTRAE